VTDGVVDTCIHHCWADDDEFLEHVEPNWRRWLGTPGAIPLGGGRRPFLPHVPLNPAGETLRDAAPAPGVAAGSSYDVLAEQLLEPDGVAAAILMHDRARLIPTLPNPHLAAVLARALNDWTLERWLPLDDRLFGVVVCPSQTPELAVDEIRRVGSHPRMVAVMHAANPLGKPFGHPIHHPIYRAAAELDLPVVIHRGGDAASDTLTMPVAGGNPTTFAELSALQAEPMMTHTLSLIAHGVFAELPTLRVFVAGVGVTWVPGLLFRAEYSWRAKRYEVPWVESPRETFQQHFRVSTYALERQSPLVERLVSSWPEFADVLCHGSGFPSWDAGGAAATRALFPAEWHARILGENARTWFRWPDRAHTSTREAASTVSP
jgi:predicted TIM-barrel fold metal-dependent hydrolase